MKLVKDFGLGIDAYPLAYVVFKIAGGDYEVATKMILEGNAHKHIKMLSFSLSLFFKIILSSHKYFFKCVYFCLKKN